MARPRVIWLAAIVIVAVMIWIIWPEPDKAPQQTSRDTSAISGDRDNAAEEVRAVATEMIEIRQQLEAQSRAQEEANRRTREETVAQIEALRGELGELTTSGADNAITSALGNLADRIDFLEVSVNEGRVELDYDVEPAGLRSSSTVIWVEPLGSDPEAAAQQLAALVPGAGGAQQEKLIDPAYTLPATTMIDAAAVTALIGRIPVDGRLETPWRFKLVSRAGNLASRGFEVPGLAGVLWSGFAHGDFTLSCVSGVIDTVTYVFDDLQSHTRRIATDTDDITAGIGWISDARGNPCITGELKTNAPEIIRKSIALNTVAGFARGYAETQKERREDATGNTSTSVTGNQTEYALSTAVADAVSESNRWLQRRIRQSFDAIYVPAGQEVVIHIEQQVEFDIDPAGRKLAHAAARSTAVQQHDPLGGFD